MSRLWQIISYPFRRQGRRPLAARRPGRDVMGQTRGVPLGMEATDMSVVNRVNRRNDALERASAVFSRDTRQNATIGSSLHVAPMPEDETYAAQYHRAYIKKDT